MFSSVFRVATIFVLLFVFCVGLTVSQNNRPDSDRSQLLQFLDQTINWYRQIDIERQIATEPDDIIAVNDDRALADGPAAAAWHDRYAGGTRRAHGWRVGRAGRWHARRRVASQTGIGVLV